jgi:sporulation protein YlmC with PRC-barrel domain
MNPSDPIKIVSQLLDLPIIDRDGNYCGVVDDVELKGSAGKETRLEALLVGPGAYAGRMPGWAMWLVRKIAGDRITRVPIAQVESIKSSVKLKGSAEKLGLHKSEDVAREWIPRVGAM